MTLLPDRRHSLKSSCSASLPESPPIRNSPDYSQPIRDRARALPTAAFRNRHNSLCYENLCHVVGLKTLLIDFFNIKYQDGNESGNLESQS